MTDQHTADGWRQVNLWCQTWQAAEQMALTHLRPLLDRAGQRDDTAPGIHWWFVRKGPSWRLRVRPVDGRDETATSVIDQVTTALTDQRVIQRWAEVVYEPEIRAFGGPHAMAVAHELFSADSHLLAHLALAHTDYRRELGLLLGTRLLRAAGQDYYEQGDIWEQVAAHRTTTDPGAPSPATIAAVRRLLTAADDTDTSPLRATPAWPGAYERAGRVLADLAQDGALTRGLRAVLAHHLLFALNRLGVSADHQYLLATAAGRVVFHHQPPPQPVLTISPERERLTTVPTSPAPTTSPDPAQLRTALADHIRGRNTFRTSRVEQAFRTVPRHLFLPGVNLEAAYAPRSVVTKRADDGTAVSSASSPNLVAEMLELLNVQPGHRVLEIGAATGINAALLAELTGPTGYVATIELDDDLATGARTGLATAGYHQVEVICGDGALGHAARGPYDRIIVTAGAWDIAPAWWDQLAAGGRLVVPLRLHGSDLTRVLPFDLHQPGRMDSTSAQVCGFVPMRGVGEQPEHHLLLADDVVLKLDPTDLPTHTPDGVPDDAALPQALTHPAHPHWTGIAVRDSEHVEHLDLWLATTDSPLGFGRLSVGSAARATGLVDPALRWSGAALYDATSLAYLAVRPVSDDINELGVIAHGPHSATLATHVGEMLTRWAAQRPTQPTITAHRADIHVDRPRTAAHIDRPHTLLSITW